MPLSDTKTAAPSPVSMVRSFGCTDRGRVREANEDQFLIADLTKTMRIRQTSMSGPLAQWGDEQGHVFLVADGMGGHAAGEHASELAVAAIEQFTLNGLKWFLHPDGSDAQRVLTEFQGALRLADSRILEEQAQHPEWTGMGTTLTLAYYLDWQLCVLHVGDSRAYLHRDGGLQQITHDHTLVAELVRQGRITSEEAAGHRLRKVITNVVGGKEAGIHIEAHALDLQPGDRILLCSDGLTEMVPNERIAVVLEHQADPEAACRQLVDEANDAGGRDNVTVVVAAFCDSRKE